MTTLSCWIYAQLEGVCEDPEFDREAAAWAAGHRARCKRHAAPVRLGPAPEASDAQISAALARIKRAWDAPERRAPFYGAWFEELSAAPAQALGLSALAVATSLIQALAR